MNTIVFRTLRNFHLQKNVIVSSSLRERVENEENHHRLHHWLSSVSVVYGLILLNCWDKKIRTDAWLCHIKLYKSWIIHSFWLALTYDLLEDRLIDDITINRILLPSFYKTKRTHVAAHLFRKRSQKLSKCGKNISDTLGCPLSNNVLFLSYFYVICDLLLNTSQQHGGGGCFH